jgi:membrane protease YdiL (CAAX protease family)
MTTTLIPARGTTRPAPRLGWPAVLAMHLLPAAATFAAALALTPLVRALDWPPQLALTLAFAFVLTPIEVGLLVRAAGGEVRRLPEILSFTRKLPLRLYLMLLPSLAAMGLGLVLVLAPLERGILDGYPASWLLPADSDAFPAPTMVAVLLCTLLVDGLIRPVVEELYFRAYLFPRLPVRGGLAVVLSAALFSAQHYWRPEQFVVILVAQLVLTAVTVRLDSVRVSIALRCLANSLGILLALAAAVS